MRLYVFGVPGMGYLVQCADGHIELAAKFENATFFTETTKQDGDRYITAGFNMYSVEMSEPVLVSQAKPR